MLGIKVCGGCVWFMYLGRGRRTSPINAGISRSTLGNVKEPYKGGQIEGGASRLQRSQEGVQRRIPMEGRVKLDAFAMAPTDPYRPEPVKYPSDKDFSTDVIPRSPTLYIPSLIY